MRNEGDETPADLLVTTDLANLWRAQQAGVLEGSGSATLSRQVPGPYHAPGGAWWGLSLRIRTPMRSTEARAGDRDPLLRGSGRRALPRKLCLRTSNNEYNQSLVADMMAKRGATPPRRLLRSWMANRPRILGSDVDVLEAIAQGAATRG